jgi:site-specific recombinase XerD
LYPLKKSKQKAWEAFQALNLTPELPIQIYSALQQQIQFYQQQHTQRHTWASWHVQNGTALHELQQLGGRSNYEMVLRYVHLSSEHLKVAAERIHDTFMPQ